MLPGIVPPDAGEGGLRGEPALSIPQAVSSGRRSGSIRGVSCRRLRTPRPAAYGQLVNECVHRSPRQGITTFPLASPVPGQLSCTISQFLTGISAGRGV
jgi:hypothetical protein